MMDTESENTPDLIVKYTNGLGNKKIKMEIIEKVEPSDNLEIQLEKAMKHAKKSDFKTANINYASKQVNNGNTQYRNNNNNQKRTYESCNICHKNNHTTQNCFKNKNNQTNNQANNQGNNHMNQRPNYQSNNQNGYKQNNQSGYNQNNQNRFKQNNQGNFRTIKETTHRKETTNQTIHKNCAENARKKPLHQPMRFTTK